MQNYTLDIIRSQNHQTYKKFSVDGINTIGVEDREPFYVKFKNNTSKRVQVRISVDGTDVITGQLASTKPEGPMFIIQAYDSLELKAWPEDSKGGAEFIFVPLGDGVASNTHGVTVSKGIIAAAVYEEGFIEPQYYSAPVNISETKTSGPIRTKSPWTTRQDYYSGTGDNSNFKYSVESTCNTSDTKGIVMENCCSHVDSDEVTDALGAAAEAMSFAAETLGIDGFLNERRVTKSKNLAVGAGERTEQNIVKTAGFKKPIFQEILQIKYMPWTELRSRVRMDTNQLSYAHPGFPGDAEKMINLKATPRYVKAEEPVCVGVIRRIRTKREETIARLTDISRFV